MIRMKKYICLLAVLLLLIFFSGCETSNDKDLTYDPLPSIEVDPFIPDDFSTSTSTAVFNALKCELERINGVTYIEKEQDTITFFDDGTWLKSETTIYINRETEVVDDTLTKKELEEKGTYTIVSGDFTSGKLTLTVTHEWDDDINGWELEHDNEYYRIIINKDGGDRFFVADGKKYILAK